MPLIYAPRGKAREYSPLALNVYSGGCGHGCTYCYCQKFQRGWNKEPRRRELKSLPREAAKASEQILLSFVSDPYHQFDQQHQDTRYCLGILRENRCSVAVLSKGGKRALRDLDLFKGWPEQRVKVGATLTFLSAEKSKQHEPGAAVPKDRLEALRELHEAGVKTWASIEPVIDPDESLAIIQASLPYVDQYKVGKLNHVKTNTDWSAFGNEAARVIRNAGKELYIKKDLRPFLDEILPNEDQADALALPEREEQPVLL